MTAITGHNGWVLHMDYPARQRGSDLSSSFSSPWSLASVPEYWLDGLAVTFSQADIITDQRRLQQLCRPLSYRGTGTAVVELSGISLTPEEAQLIVHGCEPLYLLLPFVLTVRVLPDEELMAR